MTLGSSGAENRSSNADSIYEPSISIFLRPSFESMINWSSFFCNIPDEFASSKNFENMSYWFKTFSPELCWHPCWPSSLFLLAWQVLCLTISGIVSSCCGFSYRTSTCPFRSTLMHSSQRRMSFYLIWLRLFFKWATYDRLMPIQSLRLIRPLFKVQSLLNSEYCLQIVSLKTV